MITKRLTGREINAALRSRGLTQWDLAAAAGVDQSHVSAALRGHKALGPERRARLEAAIAELRLDEPVQPGPDDVVFTIVRPEPVGAGE
jgi:transcriptional regulator with XRE-family HTH domain